MKELINNNTALCLTTLVFRAAGGVVGDIPDPGQVVGTLQDWRRTGLRSAHSSGDGAAPCRLHQVVFSLLQSWGSRRNSWALGTL